MPESPRPAKKSGGAARSRALWWLHPRFAVLFLGVPLLLLAWAIPQESYLALYETEKYVDLNFVLVSLAVYGGLLVGSFFILSGGREPQEHDAILYCRWVIWPLFGMTLFGYIAWFAFATVHAGGPGALLSTLAGVITDPEGGATDYIKFELFQTIPGITTFTQFGILYATVEALLWVNGGSRREALVRFAPIFGFTLVRALTISERLALVEFAVPLGVVLLSRVRWGALGRPLARFAPLYAVFGVFGLFAFAEYFRSWTFYKNYYDHSYLQFAAERFLGYYATALNNAAAYYYHSGVEPLKSTLNSLLDFPVAGEYLQGVYDSLFGAPALAHDVFLTLYANPEFNNVAFVGEMLKDYTIFLAPVAAFVIGAVSASIYTSFLRGRLLGLLLYPSWFIGLLEISRIYYWPGGRYFPVLGFILLSLVVFRLAKTSARKPSVTLQNAGRGRIKA